jgi:TonB-dependent starch-binding outer membrane protein SusC
MGVVTDWNMRTDAFDRWRAPGDDATLPRKTLDETKYGLDAGFPWWNTDLFVYKANYMRLRNISIGYNVKMKEKSKVQNLKIGFNISNLFVITNYPGLDPELARDFEGPQDRNLSPNVTYLTPPQERSYNISINANF